jgi:arabinan endo-1,5-alpha-L-arabinosidase
MPRASVVAARDASYNASVSRGEATMKKISLLPFLALLGAAPLHALDGDPGMHDPSTVIESGGRYYSFGTGGGLPISVSDDGWTWRRMGALMDGLPGGRAGPEVLARGGPNTWAPDVIEIDGRFYVYYSAPGTQPVSAIGLLVGTTLDPESPDYGWRDGGPVAWSDGVEDSNAIDPGVFLDPTDGRLWLTYGSYFGYIRLVELDPATGQRRYPDRAPMNIAINSEASVIIYNDGWYYLLVTHGTCCRGASSTYSIRTGRSRAVTGPYLDNMGIDMLQGGGKLVAGSGNRMIGPGHFGLIDLGDGVQKFSLHYEADLNRGGRSVLDIKPLLWRDGWPLEGQHLVPGTFEIQSARTGTSLEMAVEGQPVGGGRGGRAGGAPGGRAGGAAFGGGSRGAGPGARAGGPPAGPPAGGPPGGGPPGGGRGGRGGADAPPAVVPDQTPADVQAAWPAGAVDVRMAQYILQAQQKWEIRPADGAGGYLGAPYYKITIAGSERALAATAERELAVVPAFTGAAEQLWRIDQLTDGTYRLMPKAVPGSNEPLALTAIGSSMPTLDRFNPESDRQRWVLNTP